MGEKNRFSDASRFSLHRFWACFFSPHMARVRARDAAGFIAQNLHCETRHIAWQCVLPPAVFYFRYAFISAVWNAVLLDARNSHTDRLSCALCVCLSWSSIAAAVKCHLHFRILLYKIDVHTVSYVFRAGQNIWYIEIDLCISVNAAC